MDRNRVLLLALAATALAFGLRIANATQVYQGGLPLLAPFDELYHWKRITYSVANFPRVLEFDPDRGVAGAFCPWPPLYDLAAAGVARLAGAGDAYEVLRVIVWIPPVLTSLLIGLTVAIIARTAPLAGALAAIPLASSPFLVFASSIADVDHHFLEPFLTLAVIGGTILAMRAREMRPALIAGAVLFAALTAALFVQTALILAAALSFACLLAASRGPKPLVASIIALSGSALAVASYRLTRPAGYPDGPWFLGWSHVALLAGAALATGIVLFLDGRGPRTVKAVLPALMGGVVLVMAMPGMTDSLFGGLRFFGGDPWLANIDEFQPVWRPLSRIPNYAAALGLGAIASIALVIAFWRRRGAELTIGLFTLAYIAATLPSRRFSVVSTALAGIATAILLGHLWSRHGSGERLRRFLLVALSAVFIVLPAIQLANWWSSGVPLGMSGEPVNFLRAANLLRERGRGRVLAPWAYGHMFDVIGETPVVLDNFGTMPDPELFRAAHALMLSRSEGDVAAFCDRFGIRYVVLETPLRGIVKYAKFTGLPVESFATGNTLKRNAQTLWYWSAFFGGPNPPAAFRRIAADDHVVVLERTTASDARR